jgi:hypothetical protein
MNSIDLNYFQKKSEWNHLSNRQFPIASYIYPNFYSDNHGFYPTQLNQPLSFQNMQSNKRLIVIRFMTNPFQ